MFVSGKWCGSRREWSSPPDVARRVYSSVFLGSPGEYPGMSTTYNYLIFLHNYIIHNKQPFWFSEICTRLNTVCWFDSRKRQIFAFVQVFVSGLNLLSWLEKVSRRAREVVDPGFYYSHLIVIITDCREIILLTAIEQRGGLRSNPCHVGVV